MPLLHPVDALADIRAEIARLRAREAELRALVLALPPGSAQGRWHRAEVAERRARHLNAALLPMALRSDPAVWSERVTRYVTCLPVRARLVARPGWPMQRAGGGVALH